MVVFEKDIPKGIEDKVEIFYEAVPVVSRNPPWVGGITWRRDDLGEPLIVTTCEGIGASIWWPNKDQREPKQGQAWDFAIQWATPSSFSNSTVARD
jgi:hypothetical protein